MRPVQSCLPILALLYHAATRHMQATGGEHRSKNMTLLKRFFPRRLSRQDLERAYLNQAVSLYDLECRERDIDQGKFAGY